MVRVACDCLNVSVHIKGTDSPYQKGQATSLGAVLGGEEEKAGGSLSSLQLWEVELDVAGVAVVSTERRCVWYMFVSCPVKCCSSCLPARYACVWVYSSRSVVSLRLFLPVCVGVYLVLCIHVSVQCLFSFHCPVRFANLRTH